MKTILVAICLALIGCGNNGRSGSNGPPPPPPPQEFSTTFEWTGGLPNGELIGAGTVKNLGPDTAYWLVALVNVPYETGCYEIVPMTLVPNETGTFLTGGLRSEGAVDVHEVRVYWRSEVRKADLSIQAAWNINETSYDSPFNSYKGWGTVTNYSDVSVYDVKVRFSNDSTEYIIPLKHSQCTLQSHEVANFHTDEWIQAAGQIRIEVLWK